MHHMLRVPRKAIPEVRQPYAQRQAFGWSQSLVNHT
jgi:hypothetical protein